MKVHPGVAEPKKAKELAKKVGLNKIKTSDTYSLFKTGAKNPSSMGYPDEMFCSRGNVYVASHEDYVWIITLGVGTWFKTSPVLSCKKVEGGYKIETENSFYELRK